MDLARFLTLSWGYLNSLGNGGQDQVGQAYTIDTMLGVPTGNWGAPNGRANGIAYAFSHWNTWVNLVTSYDQNGLVDWGNAGHVYLLGGPADGGTPTGYLTTEWQGNDDCGRPTGIRWVPGKPNDEARFVQGGSNMAQLIIFFDPGGGRYRIDRHCGNPVGFLSPLTPLYNYVPGIAITAGDPLPGTAANPGILNIATNPTISFTASGRNTGPGNGPPATIRALNTNPGIVAPASFSWASPGIAAGATESHGYTHTINPATANNTVICFYVTISPVSNSNPGPASSIQFCYKIEHPRYAAVVANSSDVHAGGNKCSLANPPPTSSDIKGNPNATSGDQYVVSATGAISNFASHLGGPNNLKMGAPGSYHDVCRLDLVKAATDYQAAGKPSNPVSGTISLNAMNGVYYNTGGDLHINGGIISKTVTIVNLGGGDIYFDGNVVIDAAGVYTEKQVPSLGVISDTNIYIHNGATRVDAYLFADDTIDTCIEGDISNSVCNSTLVVNGFIMAKTLSLDRLGPKDSANQQIGEQINFLPQIYLNPPPLFDSSADSIMLQGQGERPPLY